MLIRFACFLSLYLNAVTLQNIPHPDPQAQYVIPFRLNHTLQEPFLRKSFLETFKTAFQIDTFIETGTYLGNTTAEASLVFNTVHTIELSPELYEAARERFKNQKNVLLHQGDSGKLLNDLIPTLSSRIFFYLDSHFSGNGTAFGGQNTPVLDELFAIRAKPDSVILIDDIRNFQVSCLPEKIEPTLLGYPDLTQLIDALLQINPDYQICFLGDSLLAFPPDPNVAVSPIVRFCALYRLASLCPEINETLLTQAKRVIGKAKGEEQDQLKTYYFEYAFIDRKYGYKSFATDWYELIEDTIQRELWLAPD